MDQDDTVRRLRLQQAKLAGFHVKSLAIFGSAARGQARPDSDVDVLVEFDGPAKFDQYMELKFFLEDVLGRRVDLLTRAGLRPELAPSVEREAVHVS